MVQPQPDDFVYTNVSDRPPGRLVTIAGLVVPGVARVQEQVGPYAAAWAASNRAALATGGPLWAALGDSLSQGIGAPAYDLGWVGQLHSRLAAAGRPYRLINLSVSGARTEDVLDRQLPALARLAAREALPDLITLMIGSNDLISRRYRPGLPRRFERILRQLPPGSLVTTLPNPTSTAGQVNDVIESIAGQRGLVVAELRDGRATSWRGRLAADHFHPNERGYAQLAGVIGDSLGLNRSTF
jgi:lysophospholipase L1-like esterase